MTRWARSGSTQKHKKSPEDPTPWEEFANQKRLKSNFERRHPREVKSNKLDQNTENTDTFVDAYQNATVSGSSPASFTSKEKKSQKKKLKISSQCKFTIAKEENDKFSKPVNECDETERSQDVNETEETKPKKASFSQRKKKNHKTMNNLSAETQSFTDDNVDEQDEIKITKKEIREYRRQLKKKEKAEECNTDDTQKKRIKLDNVDEPDHFTSKLPIETSLKELKIKKINFLDRLKKKRAENGIVLLPPKVEKKLYNMKRGLRNKGVPGENIREIIREIRRKEELKFRKTLKTCFKCREVGHVLANCPLLAGNNEEGTGICFKCGSTEHTSCKCPLKTSDFPFAKCFICQERGHLSRGCPKNKHGVYPKGGNCKACGSISHLKKDCPTLQNNDADKEITVGMFNDMTSVEEIEDWEQANVVGKKPKVIKF